ncbi:MAG: quinone-dependent dihydroorotate dehydrogenase [Kordiimonas sp.]
MAIDLFPFIRPIVHTFDAERAHNLTISSLRLGLNALIGKSENAPSLKTEVFGLKFPNPVGLAAGFDKNAEVIAAAHKMGFGFAEAGTVTPRPQDGNEKPRLFRLKADRAVINRFGFNNKGLEYFSKGLKKLSPGGTPFGANVGANKTSEDKTADYVTGIEKLYGLADYFTVNISSPNTPGLRALQSKEALSDLISRVVEAREKKIQEGHERMPILVKIAPDLTSEDITDISDITLNSDIDGLIVSNTTITRPASLSDEQKNETGGLSGAPLMSASTEVLHKVYAATEGKVPLVGVGGISSGADAYAKICAGASLVQVYSALVYEGPGLIDRVKKELASLLEKDGYSHISDAVGAAHR